MVAYVYLIVLYYLCVPFSRGGGGCGGWRVGDLGRVTWRGCIAGGTRAAAAAAGGAQGQAAQAGGKQYDGGWGVEHVFKTKVLAACTEVFGSSWFI